MLLSLLPFSETGKKVPGCTFNSTKIPMIYNADLDVIPISESQIWFTFSSSRS
jgi:hypothetical protein